MRGMDLEMNGDSPSTTLIRYSNDGHGVLLKDTLLLGSGRCASVREASIAGAKCAAKTISPALCGSANSIEGQVSRGCELWNNLRHPNLVPFLGIIDIPDSPLPALLTDHYHTNLHQFLLKSPTHDPHSVPLGLKISILRNVACGLAYLHMQTPPTPHGRLSAKKVLLDSGAVAKISVDVGVTVLPQPLEITPYMAPEVADTQFPITTAVDVFSFGVLALFTLTHCLPDDILPATYTEELSKKPVCRTEIERRAQSVEKIFKELGKEHPLTRMVTKCLAQEPTSRPTVSAAQSLLWQAAVLIPDPFEEKTKFDLVRDLATLSREHVRMRGEFETHDSELRDHIRALLQGMARQRKMLPRGNDEEDEEMVTEREVAYIVNFVEGIRAGRLGRELGVSEHALAIIECDPNSRRDENRKRAKVLVEWIRNTESPSWSGLVTALSSIGQKRVSDILTNDKGLQYCSTSSHKEQRPPEKDKAEGKSATVCDGSQLKSELERAKKALERAKCRLAETRDELEETSQRCGELEETVSTKEEEQRRLRMEMKAKDMCMEEMNEENLQLKIELESLRRK